MNLRKGDKVSVVGTIKFDQNGDDRVFVDVGATSDLWIEPGKLALVSQIIEVGDRVLFPVKTNGVDIDHEGEVLAISDGHAWIDLGGGDYCTRQPEETT